MSLRIIDDLEQRSEAWYAARRGMVTASAVGSLLAVGSPGALEYDCPACKVGAARTAVAVECAKDAPPIISVADNDTSRGLTALLVAERITGWTDPTFTSDDMWRGIEHEPYARDVYSGHHQQAVECGFMVRKEDGWTLGYSPDGLVASDGLVEIKCPRAKTHLKTVLADAVPAQYVPQCQAALLVSGRKWIDFVSFVAGMPLFVKRVHPDPAWHAAIVAAAQRFETTATEMVAAYTEKTKNLPATERPTELEMVLNGSR
jgi:phage FluMu protein Com